MKIIIKETKTTEEYIKMVEGIKNTELYKYVPILYTYVKIDDNKHINISKHLFNKDAFIMYLESINIPKKYIKIVENYKGGE